MAAMVVGNAGVLILVVVNLVLGARVVRGLVPRVGWSRGFLGGYWGVLGSVAAVLVMVVVCSVLSGVGGGVGDVGREREVLLFAGVYVGVLAVLPAVGVLVAVVVVVVTKGYGRTEWFGKGSNWARMGLVVFTSVLLAVGAGFRAGVNFEARPGGRPQWYHSRAAFYCFNFGIELAVVLVYTAFRFDVRFHVPDGSSAPGHYSGQVNVAGHKVAQQDGQGGQDGQDGQEGDGVTGVVEVNGLRRLLNGRPRGGGVDELFQPVP